MRPLLLYFSLMALCLTGCGPQIFSPVVGQAMNTLRMDTQVPYLAPVGSQCAKWLSNDQPSPGSYTVYCQSGTGDLMTFGGVYQAPLPTMLPQGKPVQYHLGSGIVAQAYPEGPMILWRDGPWQIQVSASPGMSLDLLQRPAQEIAAAFHPGQLPSTSAGVLGWALGGTGRSSVELDWEAQGGNVTYSVSAPQSGLVPPVLVMAARMRPYP